MIWYILVCSLIGGLSVSVTTGLGAAIVTSVMGDNQVRCPYSRESSGLGLDGSIDSFTTGSYIFFWYLFR